MTFEFRIPILPEPSFYSNVKLAALSLAKLGGVYATAPLKVSVGGHADLASVLAANRWASDYPVQWRVIPAEISDSGFSSGLDRYAYEAESDVVIQIDADACLLRPIDELLQTLRTAGRPMVAGMQAHFPPFPDHASSEAQWRALLAAEGFPFAKLDYAYSLAPPETAGRCPPYFNYGFVAFNRTAFSQIRHWIPLYTQSVFTRLRDTPSMYFSAQFALSFCMLAASTDVLPLGPAYNCPNSDEMLGHGLVSPSDIRVMHYLRPQPFDRHTFLCRREAFESFRAARFESPLIRRFQDHVLGLPGVFLDGGEKSP